MQVIRQQQIHQRLSIILSDMVARERGGEIVDKALLRSITQVGAGQRAAGELREPAWCTAAAAGQALCEAGTTRVRGPSLLAAVGCV